MGLKWTDLKKGIPEEGGTLIKLIIDVNSKKVYVVEFMKHHLDFAAKLLNIKKEDIYKNPGIAEMLVGAYILIKNKKINKIIVGNTTGLSLGAKVKYKYKTLNEAYKLIWEFVYKGEIPYERFKFKLVT